MKAIWAKGLLHEMNVAVTFQYTLTPQENTVLELAASNLYRLFVNGDFAGYGPARAAHGYSRLDSYALGKWAGQQTVLAVEVYSANINSYYTVNERPFFAAEIKNGSEIIAQAADFTAYHMTERIQKVRRFCGQRTFTESYRLARDPAAFYAGDVTGYVPAETEAVAMNRLLPRYVGYPMLNKRLAVPLEYGTVGTKANAEPRREPSYLMASPETQNGFTPEMLEENAVAVVEQFACTAQGEGHAAPIGAMHYQTYDFGRTLTGFFSLQVRAQEDTTLYLFFDEVITQTDICREVSPFRNSCNNVIKFVLAAGSYRLLTFEANSARFTTAVVTDGCAEITDFGMVVYENPDAAQFQYDCGDDALNKIVAAATNSFSQNAVDVLTDCPSRERAGWLCDSFFSGRAEPFFTGKNVVEKSHLENYAMCPQLPYLPEGMLPMCYPADHPKGRYIPNWTMWYILELCNYWKRTGDEDMRRISREKVYNLVQFFQKYENEYGLLENLESWVFIEWSKCNDAEYTKGLNYPSNMIWAAALEAAAELYNDPALAQKGAAIKKAIRELAWNGEFFEDNAVRDENGALVKTGHLTETCQYYAFYFNVISREEYPELWECMRTKFGPLRNPAAVYPEVYPSNAIVGNYLRLELLLRYGYTDAVLQECKDFFLGMAERTGTLWEHTRLSCSLNHGFASMAAVYIDACRKFPAGTILQ